MSAEELPPRESMEFDVVIVGAVRAASRAIAMAASGGSAISLRGTAGVAAGVSRNGRGGAVSRVGAGAIGASGSLSRSTGSSANAQSTPASR